MSNKDQFSGLVDEYLQIDNKYKNEINNFLNYLKDRMIEDKVFNLNVTHIDEYFVYSFDTKIGSVPTLTTHISALKALFNFLITKEINYTALYGYIDTGGFKDNLSKQLEKTFKKPSMDCTLLNSTLYKIDCYIDENINKKIEKANEMKRFFEILISRIYAKLSLILPLKPADMLEIRLSDIMNNQIREILHNGIFVKIPNSLRKNIVDTIKYGEINFQKKYSDSDKLFWYLYNVIDKKVSTAGISSSFVKTYRYIDIPEMLKKKNGGKKDRYIYPPECYKITALQNMLKNGTNIVYLKKLTGLDIGTMLSNFDIGDEVELKDIVSTNINNGITGTKYYVYL